MRGNLLSRFIRAAAMALALLAGVEAADAATLYIAEFSNGLSLVGTTQPQIPPQPALANQTVALSGASAQSAAFSSATRAVTLICDEGCSVSFGANPTATTSTFLLQQGVPFTFGVVPGQKVAAIANSAGNIPTGGGGGGGGTSSVDEASFTFGTTTLTLGGGVYQTTATSNALTNGQSGAFQVTANRALFVNLRSAAGVELGVAAAPVQVSLANTGANGTAILVTGTGGTFPVSGTVTSVGAAASGAAASGNPVLTAGQYNATVPTFADGNAGTIQIGSRGSVHAELWSSNAATPLASVQPTTDATATGVGLETATFNLLYNGTNWSRWYQAANGLNSTGTGLATAQTVGQCDDTSPTAITENNFGNARLGCTDHSQLVGALKSSVVTGLVMGASNDLTVGGAGTAGSAAGGVLTVQGAASMTPVYGIVRDAAGNARGANVNASNQLSVSLDGGTGATVSLTSGSTIQPIPGTSNGLSSYVLEPTASDNHANIKNGAGQVYSIAVFNNSATLNYIRLYNAATGFNGCNSATNLMWEGNIPASASGAGFVYNISAGLSFSTGISICVTGGYGQSNTTNATASAISVNVLYK